MATAKSTRTKKTTRTTSDAVEITERELGLTPLSKRDHAMLAENARIAMYIYELRTQAGLTQTELATRIGTTPSVISRLEDVDYGGHSLKMLRRVAWALGRNVEIRFPRDATANYEKA
jgi:ribosome-binding protein aMBF1 (putative translation factor)